jgi:hypothetical protein
VITADEFPFVSEVRSLSVSARGGGACSCGRCRVCKLARMRASRMILLRGKNYFQGVRVPARKLPPAHVRLDSYIYIKVARDKIQGFKKI